MARLAASFLLSAPVFAAGKAAPCPIPGNATQWAADYCMARLETDDEIAASRCLRDQRKALAQGECAARRHFKRALCALQSKRDPSRGSIQACVRDPAFMGNTVRNGGAGGGTPSPPR